MAGLRTIGVPAPPDEVGDGRVRAVIAAAGQVHVLGHVRQHADVGSLCAPYAQHEGSKLVVPSVRLSYAVVFTAHCKNLWL